MNKSVTLFTPKDKTFSLTTSLLTRVNIAGAIQNTGNHTLWNQVYDEFNLAFDANLSNNLQRTDRKKSIKEEQQRLEKVS